MRVLDHPVLGKVPERRKVDILVDGKTISAFEGEPIAAALIANGIKVFRYTKKKGEPRGIFCAVGQCTDCVMTINGKLNVRTCVTKVEPGMKIETQRKR